MAKGGNTERMGKAGLRLETAPKHQTSQSDNLASPTNQARYLRLHHRFGKGHLGRWSPRTESAVGPQKQIQQKTARAKTYPTTRGRTSSTALNPSSAPPFT